MMFLPLRRGVLVLALISCPISSQLIAIEEMPGYSISDTDAVQQRHFAEVYLASEIEVLAIPKRKARDSEKVPLSGLFIHLVRQGDTLQRICRMYRVEVHETRHLNGIAIDGGVSPGFQLMIPEGEVSED